MNSATFPLYVKRQDLTRFLVRDYIFRQILNVHGSIVECGVYEGFGLFTWAHLSSIYEPYHHSRKVIGFDSFQGHAVIDERDGTSKRAVIGGVSSGYKAERDICDQIDELDKNRPIGHIPKIELVVGDACQTIPEYVEKNKHLVIALLYLDFDVYAPTKVALENFVDRIPKGGIIAFDELDVKEWPGETMAVLETLGISSLRLERLPYGTMCWWRK